MISIRKFRDHVQWVMAVVVVCVCLVCPGALAWQIDQYDVDIQWQSNSSFIVTETISADFGFDNKHGIYRDIPTRYQDENGRDYQVRFDILNVLDHNQNPRKFKLENKDNFLRLKIGDPNKRVSGRHTYVITYSVQGAILFLSDHDQLYWNAIGHYWDVPIRRVNVSVALPQQIAPNLLKVKSFSGQKGSQATRMTHRIIGDQSVQFEGGQLLPFEGVTIVVGIPKGILNSPAISSDDQNSFIPDRAALNPNSSDNDKSVTVNHFKRFEHTMTRFVSDSTTADFKLRNNWPSLREMFLLIFPLTAFIVMFNIWKLYGKDPQLNKAVVVEYKAPHDLKPAEMGMLLDHSVDEKDISSIIIDLAVRGYLEIVQHEGAMWSKSYSLALLKNFHKDTTLTAYEQTIMRAIFANRSELEEVKLSDLENKFYLSLPIIKDQIKEGLKSKKLIEVEIQGIIRGYSVLAVFMLFIFVGFASKFFQDILDREISLWFYLSMGLTVTIIAVFISLMPKRTQAGAEALSKIFGFKEFLMRTEKDKIQLSMKNELYEKMLPYAIVLGIGTQWTKKFEGLYTKPPEWFKGDYDQGFKLDRFVRDLNDSMNSMTKNFYSSPSKVSSSGGFSSRGRSGGGFGGGGGGSW